jgi:DNA polymerase-3 subunit alpha
VQQDAMSAQGSLFGGGGTVESPRPRVAPIPPFGDLEKLKYEKEVIGMYVSGHPLDHFRFEIDNFCNFKLNLLTELDKLEGREIKVAGIVTAVEHRLTRTGRPFGKFTLEDYSGNFTVTLFGDDYLKYKAHLSQGLFLFLDATVARQTWGNQQLEFKVKGMDLLNDIASKRSQGLKIRLRAPEVNTESIAKLERAFSEFKGPTPVYVTVQDEQEAIQVELLSRKYRIRPGNDLVDRIRKEVSPDVEVKL